MRRAAWSSIGSMSSMRLQGAEALLAAADSAGLSGIKGHRSVGGMRASIYVAFPKAGSEALLRQLGCF